MRRRVIYIPPDARAVKRNTSAGGETLIGGRGHATLFEFAPDVGRYARRIADFARELAGDEQRAFEGLRVALENGLASTADGQEASEDLVRLFYCWSLLLDIYSAGGRVWERDSRIFVSWPEWEGGGGRERARNALQSAIDLRPLRPEQLKRVKPLFAGDTDGKSMARAMSEGEFWLETVNQVHPSGVTYGEGFVAALRLWNMPYRGRQGRQRRFVVLCKHANFGPHPVLAGIIEMGDEAPFCSWRDSLLKLDETSVLSWLESSADLQSTAGRVARRLREMRRALLPSRVARNLSLQDAELVVLRGPELERRAAGRSTSGDDFMARKRVAYGLRLARGELAMERAASGAPSSEIVGGGLLAAGVRAVHDLVIPRVHMEVSLCGSVPPFSYGLAGKLVVAFIAHPEILGLPADARGSVLEQSFDLDKLAPLLPQHGMLAATTKGLYARHSPMYNRSEVPGESDVALRLEHIANTEGATTSFLGRRTAHLARLVLKRSEDQIRRQVSQLYGTGGAKRHRTMEVAASIVGLPTRMVSAGIRRPVYAVRFARNIGDVIWLGADPDWMVKRWESGASYSARAVDLWRARWGSRSASRLNAYSFLPSTLRFIEGRVLVNG